MRSLLLLQLLLFILLLPNFSLADQKSLHIEWGYTPPESPTVSGYRLYKEGENICETENKDATSMDCNILIEKNTTSFTLTALFVDGSESPHSAPYIFVLDDTVGPFVPVAPPIILQMTIDTITLSR